jgi:hypothetical protein
MQWIEKQICTVQQFGSIVDKEKEEENRREKIKKGNAQSSAVYHSSSLFSHSENSPCHINALTLGVGNLILDVMNQLMSANKYSSSTDTSTAMNDQWAVWVELVHIIQQLGKAFYSGNSYKERAERQWGNRKDWTKQMIPWSGQLLNWKWLISLLCCSPCSIKNVRCTKSSVSSFVLTALTSPTPETWRGEEGRGQYGWHCFFD